MLREGEGGGPRDVGGRGWTVLVEDEQGSEGGAERGEAYLRGNERRREV